MLYADGASPMVQDRISNSEGRIGTLLAIDQDDFSEYIVRWDDGVIGIRYRDPRQFVLVSREFAVSSAAHLC